MCFLCTSPFLMCYKEDTISSYKSAFEEVDVGVSPVIYCCVNGTGDPWETLRDYPWIAVTFWVLSEHLVIIIVIPPELSTCMQKQPKTVFRAILRKPLTLLALYTVYVHLPLKK